MGVCACNESKQTVTVVADLEQVKDLKAIDINKLSDPYDKFEASLPFNRILLPIMLKQIDDADADCGAQGFVTIEALKNQLTSSAWEPLADSNSMLVKTLLSPAFKNEKKGHTAEQIDTEHLKIFSIVHCSGKPVDKATELFCILQDGGFEKHEYIAAGDKDFEPAFLKLAQFATLDVFRNAADAGFA